jgi:hypothetical protein
MHLYARQGDLVIEKLSAPITGELLPSKNFSFAGDSSGHRHVLRGSALTRREGARTLVRVAETSALEHEKSGGHKTVSLEPGDYEVRPLREQGSDGERDVQD